MTGSVRDKNRIRAAAGLQRPAGTPRRPGSVRRRPAPRTSSSPPLLFELSTPSLPSMTAGLAPEVCKASLHRADKAFLGGAAAPLDGIDYFDRETAEPHADPADFVLDSRPGAGGHVAGIGARPDRDPDQDAVG
jgi:hypothetical protein